MITISNAQREGYPNLNYAGTVYNCVDPDLLVIPAQAGIQSSNGIPRQGFDGELSRTAGDDKYLLMMGSIAPHKNQKDGILAAQKLGMKIVLAGKIGNMDYWNNEIKPFVDGNMVVHKGEMELSEKAALLGGAEALLFPIVWPEPFGLVMIESMACGTPVVAYNNGAVSEVVVDGKTGFVIDASAGVDGLVESVKKINQIDRAYCRTYVADHFTVEKMIESLEMALKKLVS